MFHQQTLQFKRADAVVGGLEDVVRATDVEDVTVGIAAGDIAGPVIVFMPSAPQIALHQADRGCCQINRNFSLVTRVAVRVEQFNPVTRHRATHGAGFDPGAGRIRNQNGGLGLSIAIADGDAPGVAHAVDHFRIQRFAGAGGLAQWHGRGGKILLDEHAPNGGRGAQSGDPVQ